MSILIIPLGIFLGLIYAGIDRKLTARMQNRIGPPVWQPIYDIVKLWIKEEVSPKGVGPLYYLFPILTFMSAVLVLLVIPFGPVHFSGDVFLLIYLLVMVSTFMALSGFATNNYFGFIGAWRTIVQLVGTELPFIIVIITLILQTDSLSIMDFTKAYNILPFAFIAFIISNQAKLNRGPFHIPDAETEIIAGIETEYSGRRLMLLYLTHAIELFVLVSITAAFFLMPLTVLDFLVKSLVVLFIMICMRVVVARLRIDQSFKFLWFYIAPLALIDLIRVVLL